MLLQLNSAQNRLKGEIQITGSKSESNRLLILQALFGKLVISNCSNSDDSEVMQKALSASAEVVDVHHAGTAMRFLTAYFATQVGKTVLLTGSERMQERPIKILVEALQALGADISYTNKEGYPPLRIVGKALTASTVTMQANVSSQYISALMLIAAAMPSGLAIHLNGKITSVPYINMTLSLLHRIGVAGTFEGQTIKIAPLQSRSLTQITVESDWSSASYFYSLAALSTTAQITLSSYRAESLQGDAVLQHIYEQLGVLTNFEGDKIILTKKDLDPPQYIDLDLANSPDIAQTIAVTCLGLGVGCRLKGLHTLKIKETDRLEALQIEISKLGGSIQVTSDRLILEPLKSPLLQNIAIATYKDHRMAMAFAPLALKVPIQIKEAKVVSKSYPDFWDDLNKLGIQSKIIG